MFVRANRRQLRFNLDVALRTILLAAIPNHRAKPEEAGDYPQLHSVRRAPSVFNELNCFSPIIPSGVTVRCITRNAIAKTTAKFGFLVMHLHPFIPTPAH